MDCITFVFQIANDNHVTVCCVPVNYETDELYVDMSYTIHMVEILEINMVATLTT